MNIRMNDLVHRTKFRLQRNGENTAPKSKSTLFINNIRRVKRESSKVSKKYQNLNGNKISNDVKNIFGEIRFPVIYCNKLPPIIHNEKHQKHIYSTGDYIPMTKPLKVNKVKLHNRLTINQQNERNLTKRELIRIKRIAEAKSFETDKKSNMKCNLKPRTSKNPQKADETRLKLESSKTVNSDQNYIVLNSLPIFSSEKTSTESEYIMSSLYKRNQHKLSQRTQSDHINSMKTMEDKIQEYYIIENVEPVARDSNVMKPKLTQEDFKKVDNRCLYDISSDVAALNNTSDLVSSSSVFKSKEGHKNEETNSGTRDYIKVNFDRAIDGNIHEIESVKLPLKSVGSRYKQDCESFCFDRSNTKSINIYRSEPDQSSVLEYDSFVELIVPKCIQNQKTLSSLTYESSKKSSNVLSIKNTNTDEYSNAHTTSFDKGIPVQPDIDSIYSKKYLLENDLCEVYSMTDCLTPHCSNIMLGDKHKNIQKKITQSFENMVIKDLEDTACNTDCSKNNKRFNCDSKHNIQKTSNYLHTSQEVNISEIIIFKDSDKVKVPTKGHFTRENSSNSQSDDNLTEITND